MSATAIEFVITIWGFRQKPQSNEKKTMKEREKERKKPAAAATRLTILQISQANQVFVYKITLKIGLQLNSHSLSF